MIIGFITSTKYSGPTKVAFLKGLRASGWEGDSGVSPGGSSGVLVLPYEADGNYDDGDGGSGKRQELYNAISNFNGTVDLIVAAGGLVSAHAAVNRSHKPFLVLIGATPQHFDLGSNANFRGGVNLDLPAKDVARHDELCSFYGISDPKKICLLWNSNSKMGRHEKKAWVTDNGWPLCQEVKKNAENSINDAFVKAKNSGAKGIVISGDPYFTSRMNAVVAAANASKLKVCYPFAVYKAASPPPAPGFSMCYGPDLVGAYNVLGQKAGTILTALASGAATPSTGLTVARTAKPEPLRKKIK